MISEILTAVLAIVASIAFTLWIRWYDNNNKEKEANELFKLYKKYAKECLEELIYYHKQNKIRYTVDTKDNIEYSLEDLKFELIIKTGNKMQDIDKEDIISIILSFMAEKYFLDEKEQILLYKILKRMTLNSWIIVAKYQNIETNCEVEFSGIAIWDKNNRLSSIKPSLYCRTLPNVNQDFLEKILEQLKHDELDERIKKIIKKGVQE